MDVTQIQSTPQTKAETNTSKGPLFDVAQELEVSFLAEMLKSAGLGQTRKTFGGGAGEDQFSSFLVQEHAKELVKSGGIGLAESIYQSLLKRSE